MLRWLKRSKELVVGFCDGCAKVCDPTCRTNAVREQAALRALRLGVRV